MPAADCCLRPATRTWKNSSRLLLKIARNLSRSSSGVAVVEGFVEDPAIELEPGQLAIQVETGVPEVDRGRRDDGLEEVGHYRNVRAVARGAERIVTGG